ncbi:hypothetical protein AB205_0214370 [Aquarana catesbeiana]|uniref:Uncharacterized protein n=1 Tax=Aquarana catesbeiana TaxID=8400 RepID=A0A2G9S769_AQUCT|nr:hypothetical protein AB205_0214370 [Aquarana catesbeiana]
MLKAMTYMDEKDLFTFHGEDTGKNFHCRFVWIEDLINTDVKLILSEPSWNYGLNDPSNCSIEGNEGSAYNKLQKQIVAGNQQ